MRATEAPVPVEMVEGKKFGSLLTLPQVLAEVLTFASISQARRMTACEVGVIASVRTSRPGAKVIFMCKVVRRNGWDLTILQSDGSRLNTASLVFA